MTTPQTKLLIRRIQEITHLIMDEGTDQVEEHLNEPIGGYTRSLRRAGLNAEQLNAMPNDDDLLNALMLDHRLQPVMRRIIREALVTLANDAASYEAEHG
jgi:hypothetical protein